MDNQDIPQFTFPLLDIAVLKDNILKYLFDSSNPESSEQIYVELNLNIPKEDYHEYIREMGRDDYIIFNEMSGNRKILKIKDKGKMFYRGGGYTAEAKDGINDGFKKLLDEEKRQEKLDLEILSLRAGLKHNKSTRKIAIIALVISGLSFLFLITKEIILKLILINH